MHEHVPCNKEVFRVRIYDYSVPIVFQNGTDKFPEVDDLGVSAIYVLSASPNISSAKLQDRCGFSIVGEIPNKTWIDGSTMSLIQRKISADEYYDKKKLRKQ